MSRRVMHETTTEFGDGDLTFFMLVYRDHERADRCLQALRRHLPEARVIVRADGDPDPRHGHFINRYRVDYRAEGRLFPVGNGGAIVTRMFEIYLEKPTRYLFKIDPDSAVHRRFRWLPVGSGHFGTLQGPPGARAVQGGCLGFTRAGVGQFMDSGLLECPALKNPESWRSRSDYWRILANRARRCGLSSFDWTLGWIAAELAMPLFDFDEVHSTWKDPVDNTDLRFAITHPVCQRDDHP